MRIPKLSWRHAYIVALIAGFFHLLFYAVWIPPWQFPDEPRHFEYVRLVDELGHAPGWNERDLDLEVAITRSMAKYDFWRFGFAVGPYVPGQDVNFADVWTSGYQNVHFHPPLYYRLMAWLTGFIPLQALETQLFLLRLISVLIATFSLAVMGLTGVALRNWRWGFGIVVFAALLPNRAFIQASVNNDVLAEFFAAWVVTSGVVIMRRGWRAVPLVLLVGSLILAVMTKRSTVFLVFYAAAALAVGGWFHHASTRHGWLSKGLIVGGTLLFLALAVGAAWYAGRVQILGDRLLALLHPAALYQALRRVPWHEYTTVMFQSFWARLGWLRIVLPSPTYHILWLLTGGAFLGWLGRLVDWWRNPSPGRAQDASIGAVFLFTVLVQWGMVIGKEMLHFSGTLHMVPQGRYLYPFLPVYALFYVGGWEWGLRKARLPAMTVIVVALTLFALFAVWHTMGYFYGTG
ncbi:MAG: hypothetical protein GXO55_04020 [Chloroflexi bacterium]|nr:hypothetical protein [Chloroflexota bacterium]